MESTKIENHNRILSIINRLPPMPENIIRLRQVCADPNASYKDIVPIIEKDPAFCTDILRMANSAYFGLSHTVESISEAIRYIGFNSVAEFVAISFSNKVLKSEFAKVKELDDYFKHSKEIATATKFLAKCAGKSAREQEFFTIAGLLHDIGRLVILLVSDKEAHKLLSHNWNHQFDRAEKEEDIFGTNHCEIGQEICSKWEFSDQLQEAVLRHHAPLKGELNQEAAYILLAHFISMRDFPAQSIINLYPIDVLEEIGLSYEKILDAQAMYDGIGD